MCVSPAMVEIMKLVERVADIDAPILITGETGTGKDYIARYIHFISPRRNHLFVKVNCPALPPSLFASELIGRAKGGSSVLLLNAAGLLVGQVGLLNF